MIPIAARNGIRGGWGANFQNGKNAMEKEKSETKMEKNATEMEKDGTESFSYYFSKNFLVRVD